MLEAVLHRAERRTRSDETLLIAVIDVARSRRRPSDARVATRRRPTPVPRDAGDVLGGDADRLATVGADLERDRAGRATRTVEQLDAVERGLVGWMSVISDDELLDLGHDGRLVLGVQGAVVVLHLEIADALEHRVHLVEGTLRRLDERDAVLRVALRLGETTDLSAHLLRDGEAGGVVGGTVDAVTGRQLLHRLGSLGRGAGQLTVGVERLNVVLDSKAHGS